MSASVTLVMMLLRYLRCWLRRSKPGCVVCENYGVLWASWVYDREPVCDCGQSYDDRMAMHDVYCDTVPCPFCRLADVAKIPVKESA